MSLELAEKREKLICQLEEHLTMMPQVDCPVKHHFAPGLYMREIFMPAGSIVIGATHKTTHLNTVISGTVLVVADKINRRITGPDTFISKAGVRKTLYNETDVIWATYHPTDTTDIEELTEELTTMKNDEIVGGRNNKQLLMNKQQQTIEVLP